MWGDRTPQAFLKGMRVMSGVNGVTASNADLYQLFAQSVQNTSQANLVPAASGSGSQATSATTLSSESSSTGVGSLQDQLISAITTAVQNAEQSGNTSDLNSVVKNAVDQVLQNNGIDPSSVAQQAQGAHGHHHHHGHGGGVGQNHGSSGTTDGASSTVGLLADSSGGSSANSGSSSQQPGDLIAQLLGLQGSSQGISGLLLDQRR